MLVDRVLCSIGWLPVVEGLGLESRGVPAFDPHSMQVADLPVFIAGDVTGERQVLHEAADAVGPASPASGVPGSWVRLAA